MGSESSSVVVGGVWKSGNLEIWDFGNLEIWGPGNPEILRFGDLEIQKCGVQKMKKIKVLKNQIRSAQNVGKVWISRKKSSRPYLGPSEAIFPWTKKIKQKTNANFCLFFAYFPGVGPLLLSTRGGE